MKGMDFPLTARCVGEIRHSFRSVGFVLPVRRLRTLTPYGRSESVTLEFPHKDFCCFRNYAYLCSQSGKDPLWQKKRYARIANENVRNFQGDKQYGTTVSRYMRGAVTQFLIRGDSHDLHSELAKAALRFCYGWKYNVELK